MRKNFQMLLIILVCGVVACRPGQKRNGNMGKETVLEIETSSRDIKMKLYNKTLKHRDNFIKLAEDGTYNGTLFHHVIKNFMVQVDDPESKSTPKSKMLGSGDVGYIVLTEFAYPRYLHKKGVLPVARQGDEINPNEGSSDCQFHVTIGKVFSDSTLLNMEQRENRNKVTEIFSALVRKHMKEIYKMRRINDQGGLFALQDTLFIQTEAEAAKQPDSHFTPEQMKTYTTVGGTPHLDDKYTIFGEVIGSMDVISKIQQVKTDHSDRPEEDVKIISVSVIE